MNKNDPMIGKYLSMIDTMALSKRAFIERNLAWMKEFDDGKYMTPDNPLECPLNQWVVYNSKKCSRQMVPLTAACPLCGKPMCPDCNIHTVEQLSRVTGYLSGVSGWNEAKKQEFKDRERYQL